MDLFRRSLNRLRGAQPADPPTHVVPLGVSCRVAYQVRTYFASPTAHPFDWWLTPIVGLTSYLANPDPLRIYGEGALAELTVGGHVTTVVAPEFGFQLFHEFPRQDVGLPTRVVTPDWRRCVAEARERHTRRLERLLALDRQGHRLLFVRDRLGVDGLGDGRPPAEALAELWRALSRRWSRAEVTLLLINVPGSLWQARLRGAASLRNVRQVEFEDLPGTPPEVWQGDTSRWASAFSRAGYPRNIVSSSPVPAVGPPD